MEKESKMFKNRSILVIAVLSILMVAMAVSRPFYGDPTAEKVSAPSGPVMVPVTGDQEASQGAAIRELRQENASLNNQSTDSSQAGTGFEEYDLGQFRREELSLSDSSANP